MMASQKQEQILHCSLQTDSNHFQCRNHILRQFGFLGAFHFIHGYKKVEKTALDSLSHTKDHEYSMIYERDTLT